MKKSTKKLLTISGSIFGVGAITTSIALPIVLNMGKIMNLDPKAPLYDFGKIIDGKPVKETIGQFIERLKTKEYKEKGQLKRFDYLTAFFLYEIEQKGSLELQKMWFKWGIYEFDKKITELNDNPELVADKTKMDDEIKKINDQKNKIKDLLTNIEKATNEKNPIPLDYKSSSFKTDYPKVLLPLKLRIEEQERIYNDIKNNEISKHATRLIGELEWTKKRLADYDGATSDKDAIDFQTNKIIKDEAFGQFQFKFNGDFTYEHKYAQYDGKIIFEFLKEATENDDLEKYLEKYKGKPNLKEIGKTELETKIYFISSHSSNPANIFLNLQNNNEGIGKELLTQIAKEKLIKIQNALISYKQNVNGSLLPWKFANDQEKDNEKTNNEDPLKTILSFFGQGDNTRRVLDILGNVFKDNKNDDTNIFVDNFSADRSLKEKEGSLGVGTLLEYIKKDNEGGFGFGIMAILQREKDNKGGFGKNSFQDHDQRIDKNYLTILKEKIEDAMKEVWGEDLPKNQKELDQKINDLKDKERETFGKAFRDTFDPEGKGLELFYPAGEGVNIVFSEKGMNIIKITELDQNNTLEEMVKKDLKQIANNKDVNKTETNWDKLFSKHFEDNGRREFIIKELGEQKDSPLRKYIDDKESQRQVSDKINWEDIKGLVNSLQNSKQIKDVMDALGSKTKDFYLKNIDKELRKIDAHLDPHKIYEILIGGLTNV